MADPPLQNWAITIDNPLYLFTSVRHVSETFCRGGSDTHRRRRREENEGDHDAAATRRR